MKTGPTAYQCIRLLSGVPGDTYQALQNAGYEFWRRKEKRKLDCMQNAIAQAGCRYNPQNRPARHTVHQLFVSGGVRSIDLKRIQAGGRLENDIFIPILNVIFQANRPVN